jgi:hypothetical protein
MVEPQRADLIDGGPSPGLWSASTGGRVPSNPNIQKVVYRVFPYHPWD